MRLAAMILTLVLGVSHATADLKGDLIKLLPKAPDGWGQRADPEFTNAPGNRRVAVPWGKSSGGQLEIAYFWKVPYASVYAKLLKNPAEAKSRGYGEAQINGAKWVIRKGGTGILFATMAGPNVLVMLRGNELKAADVKTIAALINLKKLAEVKE
jgi:hypothetical protein